MDLLLNKEFHPPPKKGIPNVERGTLGGKDHTLIDYEADSLSHLSSWEFIMWSFHPEAASAEDNEKGTSLLALPSETSFSHFLL